MDVKGESYRKFSAGSCEIASVKGENYRKFSAGSCEIASVKGENYRDFLREVVKMPVSQSFS